MLQTIWHHSSVQFPLLFQMVHFVLLSVLPFKTILFVDPDWLLKVFHQSAVGVLKGNTASKMEYNISKSNENWTDKWCQIVCSILFDLFLCMTSSGQDACKHNRNWEVVCKDSTQPLLSFIFNTLIAICYLALKLLKSKDGNVVKLFSNS